MARSIRDAKLETRNARSKLPSQKEPYWRLIAQGCHIGYYKGSKSATWVARYRNLQGKYVKTKIGVTDDIRDADGVSILDFNQAQKLAREWYEQQANKDLGLDHTGPYTVDQAIEDYLEWYKAHRKSLRSVQYSMNSFVLPEFSGLEVSHLTPSRLRKWHHKLAATPARKRTRTGSKQQFRAMPENDPEILRKRKATANRILTVFKAALNHAFREGKVQSDDAWRRVKPFAKVDAPRIQYLSEEEIVRLVNACPSDFRKLVKGALFTGCRYSELGRMQVMDFNTDGGTVQIRESKSGKPRHVVLTDEGQEFFHQITAGRAGDETIFLKESGGKWLKSHQLRPLKDACENGNIKPAISFHILRHTHASHLAMNGVPMAVIAAQLGHSDTRTVERHYAHLAPSYIADTIRAHFPKLGITEKSNVTRIA